MYSVRTFFNRVNSAQLLVEMGQDNAVSWAWVNVLYTQAMFFPANPILTSGTVNLGSAEFREIFSLGGKHSLFSNLYLQWSISCTCERSDKEGGNCDGDKDLRITSQFQ